MVEGVVEAVPIGSLDEMKLGVSEPNAELLIVFSIGCKRHSRIYSFSNVCFFDVNSLWLFIPNRINY